MAQVKYKGKVIADISKGQKLTLRVDGHELEGDIVIDGFNGGGSSNCDGCIIEVDTLPTENIDETALYKVGESYHKYSAGAFFDVIMYMGEASSLVEMIALQGATAELFQVTTKPTENIVASDGTSIYAFYYIEDEDDVFLYMDNAWITLSEMFGGYLTYKGAISDISEATEDGYYVVGGSRWTNYIAPSGSVLVTESSVVDVTDKQTVIVSVAAAFTVQTVADLPVDASDGSLAIVLGGA